MTAADRPAIALSGDPIPGTVMTLEQLRAMHPALAQNMTLREHYAGLALGALTVHVQCYDQPMPNLYLRNVASTAVQMADALLAELERARER